MAGAELLGRTEEQAAIERLLERASSAPAGLLLDGEAGIGKTTVWRRGIALAHERGFRVLACVAAPTETPLSFTGLGDLLDEMPLEILKRLPPPQRRALEISLLLTEPSEGTADQRAVSLALLTVIRTIAESRPLLIAIDDVQWLDGSSAGVLSFALRRIRTGPVGLLLTRRSEGGMEDGPPLGFDRSDELALGIERRTLGPLSLGAIAHLLSERVGERVPRPLLSQIFRASGGNPFYALELAQAERSPAGGEHLINVPEHLRALVSGRLAALPEETRETLLIVTAMSEPTVETVKAAGGGGLDPAVEAGVIEISAGRIRFCHPLHSSVLYSDAEPERRRELHRHLAEVVSNREERARHLALGSTHRDESVAAELEQAARQAAARGARAAAAELYEYATRLTPPARGEDLHRRRVKTAEHYYSAGDLERSRALVDDMLAGLPAGPERSDVLVLLADMMEDLPSALAVCHEAIEAAAGDDIRLATAYIRLAAMSARVGESEERIAAQRQALIVAEHSGDPNTLVEALQGVANITVQSGGQIDEALMERALEIDKQVTGLTTFARPSLWYGMQLYWTDELPRARELLAEAAERAARASELTDRLHILGPLIEVEFRLGHIDEAERMAAEGLEQALDIGQDFLVRSIALQRLQISILRGEVESARNELSDLTSRAEQAGDSWQILSLRSLAATLALSLGDVREAWRSLEPAIPLQDSLKRDYTLGMAPLFSIRPNAIEALIGLDELDRAESLLAAYESDVERTRRPNALVGSARSRGILSAASGDLEGAKAALERALEAHEKLPDPFELARTLLVLGTVERRAKRKRDARAALEKAAEIFSGLGARLWVEKTTTELERVSGRRDTGSLLTPTELQVAELVASGRSNREVAAQLFLSVRTVEANLSNIYRKLDIESRSELAAKLQELDSASELEAE